MCAQTRPRFILSSQRAFWGMESEPLLTTRGKSPLPEIFSSEEDETHDAASSRTANPTHYQRAFPATVAADGRQGWAGGLGWLLLLVGCLTSQQHASVSQGRICTDNFTCCHTEMEAGDPTFHLTQSQYTDTGPTSPSADPIIPGAWQGSHWSANF